MMNNETRQLQMYENNGGSCFRLNVDPWHTAFINESVLSWTHCGSSDGFLQLIICESRPLFFVSPDYVYKFNLFPSDDTLDTCK